MHVALVSKALADNDGIYAIIRGGAFGTDGKTDGVAQPSYEAQVAVLEKAYRNAGVHLSQVVAVEAHGTVTCTMP